MLDEFGSAPEHASRMATVDRSKRSLLGRFATQFSDSPVSFDIILPDGTVQPFGPAPASFALVLKNERALRAIASIDEGRIGGAYVAGDFDIEGDMLGPFRLRDQMKDLHPIAIAWRFLQPLLFGQIRTNRRAISDHYDMDSDFFLSFLDPKTPLYTQGIYVDPDESLESATVRKFEYCYDKCRLKSGDRILEIGPGWGAWFEYASRRGVQCTGITISQTSADYLNGQARELGFDWEIVLADLLEYKSEREFDAIVIMGVIEHLPRYESVLRKFASLIKPGGHVFLDASACTKKYELSSYMVKYIYGGNHSFLVLHDFLEKLARTSFEVLEIQDDRHSYYLTFMQWARNFEANKNHLIERFGDFHYRRFRLYLWGSAYEFLSRSVSCYRMILRHPD